MTRSVLVTGATSGIGLATALHLAHLGFETIGSARTPEHAEELRRAAAEAGVDVEVVLLDLTDPEAGTDLAERGLWAVVNNVGWMNLGLLEDVPLDRVHEQFEAMVLAPVRLAQQVLPGMRARGEGRIVVVSTVGAHTEGPMMGWYQAAKHALATLADVLRAEASPYGIDVVAVEPGGFRTRIWPKGEHDLRTRREGSPFPEAYDRALEVLHALQPHMPEPEPVAEVIGEALTAGRPKARYRVGASGTAIEVASRVLPRPVRDRLARTTLGLELSPP